MYLFYTLDIICLSDDSTSTGSAAMLASSSGTQKRKGDAHDVTHPKRRRLEEMFLTPYATGSTHHRKLTELVCKYILIDGLPLYTVEKRGFREMLSGFDSRYLPRYIFLSVKYLEL